MVQTKEPRLSLALALAREAGRYALDHAADARAVWKRPGERLTATDLEVQSRMVREVAAAFPGDGLLAEEEDLAFGLDPEFVWVLDPLDGTNNYALGIPCFAVSIGVLRAGSPHLGVIHDPNTGFTAWAVRETGAFAGERSLSLAGGELTAASNVCVRIPLHPALAPVAIDWMRRFKFRSFGSVALQLAYVATGGVDLFPTIRLRCGTSSPAPLSRSRPAVASPTRRERRSSPSSSSTIVVAPSRSSPGTR